MKMIYVGKGKKCMQRCIDRGSYRVVAERTERIQTHHLVFQFDAAVNLRQGEHLIEVQSSKAFDLDAAQVAATPLHPQDGLLLPVERICPLEFRTGITAAEVGDA